MIPTPGLSGFPEEEMGRRYRNVIIAFKKKIETSDNVDDLKGEMEHFLNTGRRVAWPHKTGSVFHKDEAEKAVGKVLSEFQRYITALQQNPKKAVKEDLLESLRIVQTMLDSIKGR